MEYRIGHAQLHFKRRPAIYFATILPLATAIRSSATVFKPFIFFHRGAFGPKLRGRSLTIFVELLDFREKRSTTTCRLASYASWRTLSAGCSRVADVIRMSMYLLHACACLAWYFASDNLWQDGIYNAVRGWKSGCWVIIFYHIY